MAAGTADQLDLGKGGCVFGQPDVRVGKAAGEHQCLAWPWEAGVMLC